MSATRILSASSLVDRDVATHVHVAELAIRAALRRLDQEKREGGNNAYLARVRRDLERCLGATLNVRRVHPYGPPVDAATPANPPVVKSLTATEPGE